MTNLKLHNLNELPAQLEVGHLYFLTDGTIHIGKSDGTALSFYNTLNDKVNQTDLDTILADYYANVTDNIMGLFDKLNAHEKSLITSETGVHNIRYFDSKFEQFDEATSTWIEILSSGAPTEHTHTTDEILGLTEFVNNLIAGLATGEIELTDASLIAKGIVQLSNDIDSEDETKASTPLALKTAINDIKALYKQAIEDSLVSAKVYTDNEIDKLTTSSNDLYASKVHTHIISDTTGLQEALDLKSDKVMVDNLTTNVTSNTSEITGIKNQLANGVASATHKHPISDVNLLQDTLDLKANRTDLQLLSNNFNTHKHEIADVSELQTELDSKALKTEFNVLKSNFDGHKHEITDVNLLQDTLANKAPLSHTHAWNQITGRPTSTTTQIDNVVNSSHLHSNMNILENLEDGNGVLIYNGSPLGEVAYISVETIIDRDTIPMTARKEGLMVLVIEDGGMYYLKGGIDNAFWQIFATGQGGATNALTLPANPIGNLTGTNTQSLIEQLESRKADKNEVYSKAEMTTFMENYPIDYLTLENLPNLSQLHWHENKETLDLFNQYQGNLTWKGKTLGDLMTEIYDADKDGIIDLASKLDGQVSTIAELNYLSGTTGNIQSQINSLSSGTTYRGEYPTYQEMIDTINNPSKGDWVFILSDENKGAENTQYLHDGVDWVYGGGTAKTPDATSTTKGVIQLGGDLAGTGTSSTSPKLTETGVTAGLYKSANITVDSSGRITHAEEGSVIFLNDSIVSEDEGWSSNKINEELNKKADRNHTHPQLHDANKLGSVTLDEINPPTSNSVIGYNQETGKAEWITQSGGKVYVGSKAIDGDFTLKAGSYISLLVDEVEKTITISSTYRDGGGTSLIPSGVEITHTITVQPNSSERFSVEAGFNKVMLHTVQMSNDKSSVSELRIYNQSSDGFIEYNSNPEMFISDIVNIPIFDYDNSKMMHLEVVNNGIDEAKFKIRLKVTNLQ